MMYCLVFLTYILDPVGAIFCRGEKVKPRSSQEGNSRGRETWKIGRKNKKIRGAREWKVGP